MSFIPRGLSNGPPGGHASIGVVGASALPCRVCWCLTLLAGSAARSKLALNPVLLRWRWGLGAPDYSSHVATAATAHRQETHVVQCIDGVGRCADGGRLIARTLPQRPPHPRDVGILRHVRSPAHRGRRGGDTFTRLLCARRPVATCHTGSSGTQPEVGEPGRDRPTRPRRSPACRCRSLVVLTSSGHWRSGIARSALARVWMGSQPGQRRALTCWTTCGGCDPHRLPTRSLTTHSDDDATATPVFLRPPQRRTLQGRDRRPVPCRRWVVGW